MLFYTIAFVQTLSEKIFSEREDDEGQSLHEHVPPILFLVRDFTLEKGVGDSYEWQQQYMNKTLTSKKGFTAKVNSDNVIRAVITGIFSKRECITLRIPAMDEDVLETFHQHPKFAQGISFSLLG
jgi:hypothetical protein